MRIPRKHFPAGAVRETRQWTYQGDFLVQLRYDFRFRDPASGADLLYYVTAWADEKMSTIDVDQRIAEPAIACLERMVHRKCGMDEAIKNQIPLTLPHTVEGRFV